MSIQSCSCYALPQQLSPLFIFCTHIPCFIWCRETDSTHQVEVTYLILHQKEQQSVELFVAGHWVNTLQPTKALLDTVFLFTDPTCPFTIKTWFIPTLSLMGQWGKCHSGLWYGKCLCNMVTSHKVHHLLVWLVFVLLKVLASHTHTNVIM